MKNLSKGNEDVFRMKHYLLSEQDLKEIYWCYEMLVKTIEEILKRKEVHQEPD